MGDWLLIDDIRNLAVDITVRTPHEARELLADRQDWECVIFDNDLGHDDEGQYILAWMLEELKYKPPRIQLVTDNTPTLLNMRRILSVNGYKIDRSDRDYVYQRNVC